MTERPTLTGEQMDALAHEMRLLLQERACCPGHASAVCVRMLAGFALDDADDNTTKAAATLTRVAHQIAGEIRRGKYFMVRTQQ
jgi:hypothetical protein